MLFSPKMRRALSHCFAVRIGQQRALLQMKADIHNLKVDEVVIIGSRLEIISYSKVQKYVDS